ncbi:MAG: hypothetical protein RLZZ165_1812 [Bacteroidota bacterium]|jgi:hypothetical protein
MRHILKSANNEPQSLRDYRRTPDATYRGYTDKYPSTPHHSLPPLKNMHAQEQGYICCY